MSSPGCARTLMRQAFRGPERRASAGSPPPSAGSRSVRCSGARTHRGWCFCMAAARTPTPGTPWSSRWAGLRSRSTCPVTGTPVGGLTMTPDIVALIRQWAPGPEVIVGMSLGGLTTIRLTAAAPDLVARAVIVDVTPSAQLRQQSMTQTERGTTALVRGPASFATFEEIVNLTAAAAPHRPLPNIRRGVRHNTRQHEDGRWEWRYDRLRDLGDFSPLWDDVSAATIPLTLVRGGASAFVTDEDAAEFLRRSPSTQVHVVPGAGHSVQSDAPLALASIIGNTLDAP